jgi:methionyl-tRNA synthetase
MAQKYRGGKLARFQHPGSASVESIANSYVTLYRERFDGIVTQHDGTRTAGDPYQIHLALAAAFDLASHCNQFIESEKPWALAKDPEQASRLDAALYHLADSLRILAILISPVLPRAAAGIFEQLGWKKPFLLADAAWGGLPDGHVLGVGVPLFPRLELPAE